MSLKNQKGIVRYQGRDDIVCAYGIRDDGKQFYYLDTEGKTLKNGNRIATTALVEAVDPMVKSSNIGVIDSEGKEIIPFNNRSIRLVNDDILLVEPAVAVTPSVLDAINVKSDPTAATKLVSTQAQIREKLNGKVGAEGRYLFNDQFSEATICDINGNNLVGNALYSFIVGDGRNLYFSKNTADSDIISYSILPPQVQSNVAATDNNQAINVNNVSVAKEVVENALNEKENTANDITAPVEAADNSSQVEEHQNDNVEVTAPQEGVVQETPLTHLNNEVENSVVDDAKDNNDVQDTNVEGGFEIPSVPVDNPEPSEEEHNEAQDTNVEGGVEIPSVPVDNPESSEEEHNEAQEDIAETVEEDIEEKSIEHEDISTDSSNMDESEEPISENEDNNVSDEEVALNDDIMKEANKDEFEEDSMIEEESDEFEEDNSDEISKDNDNDYDFDDLSYNDIDNQDLDDLTSVDDLDDDLLEKASVKVDHIDTDDIEDMDGFRSKDNIMADVAKSLTAMMNKCKVLEAQHSEDTTRIEKLSSSRKTVIEKNKLLGKKVENLTNKNATTSASLSQEKSKNSILENRLQEQKRVIEAQARELELLRPLLQGKDEVVGILADVQALLDEN